MQTPDFSNLVPTQRESIIDQLEDEIRDLRQQALHIILTDALAQAKTSGLDAEDLIVGLNQYLDDDVLYVRQGHAFAPAKAPGKKRGRPVGSTKAGGYRKPKV
ncbi:hypothetical protein QTI05_24255 [Variovorax sp. J22R193]|uniref:hypothetical protein n=1 Tax=Variovorax fucosicus TaxID=3053517 RepID=UPI0025781201|nr:hypothetical protein [Variovorax sp. J22R193]MDM0042173.1 hypothetical protein [Variovorax sp. J22R193]